MVSAPAVIMSGSEPVSTADDNGALTFSFSVSTSTSTTFPTTWQVATENRLLMINCLSR